VTPSEALAAQPAPACPDDGRMGELTPPPGRNRRAWGCPVCGLIAVAAATPEAGYLLWEIEAGGPLGGIMIAIGCGG
jgi:hypothetical protein